MKKKQKKQKIKVIPVYNPKYWPNLQNKKPKQVFFSFNYISPIFLLLFTQFFLIITYNYSKLLVLQHIRKFKMHKKIKL